MIQFMIIKNFELTIKIFNLIINKINIFHKIKFYIIDYNINYYVL